MCPSKSWHCDVSQQHKYQEPEIKSSTMEFILITYII